MAAKPIVFSATGRQETCPVCYEKAGEQCGSAGYEVIGQHGSSTPNANRQREPRKNEHVWRERRRAEYHGAVQGGAMRIKAFVLALAVGFGVSAAQAQFRTGATLREDVEAYESSNPTVDDRVKRMYLVGYVAGVVDSFNDWLFCIPSGVTHAQITAVYIKWHRNNPELWNLPGSRTVALSLSAAFPCPQKGK